MMTRTRHSSRRPGRADAGAHWISYSDMMASLLLVFVLAVCYSVYQYYNMLEIKTKQLNAQAAELERQQGVLAEREKEVEELNVTLMGKEKELHEVQIQLDRQKDELNAAQTALTVKEGELEALQLTLNEQKDKLSASQLLIEAQQAELARQQARINALIGVRTEIIQTLSYALGRAGLNTNVDANTGDIVLEGSILFDTAKSDISEEGKAFLNSFLPVYLNVLLSREYNDYVAEIVIEGHADTTGTYSNNINYATERAKAVARYCLDVPGLTPGQRTLLEKLLTVSSRSSADPIFNPDGTENKIASRRVEFKFRMRDAEMIEELNALLAQSAH